MKKSTYGKWYRIVVLIGLMAGFGVAQATPVCNPDYSLNLVSGVVTTVTLTANCTPDPGQSINAANGYQWNPTLDSTSSPQPIPIANVTDGAQYQVRATEDGNTYGPYASVTVHTGSPLSCSLSAMVGGALQPSVSIGNGQSATLVPNCPGAFNLDWYAAAPNSAAAGTLISAPTGGVVSPTSSTAYYVVGTNDVSDTASNAVTVTVSPAQVAPQASCSLTASASSVISGTPVTLTAANVQNADTYIWAAPLASCNGQTSCTFSPTTSAIYTLNVSTANSSSTPGSCSATVAVGKGSQTITFNSAPAIIAGGTGTVSANGGASGLPVTFTSTTTGVCTVSGTNGSTVTAAAGSATQTCTIAANQAGNSSYNAAPQVTQNITIGSASLQSQTISFTSSAPGSATVGGATYTPSASATSGLTVTITVDASASSVCSISGGNVSFLAAGTCTLDANQSGNGSYNAAPQQQQSFGVTSSTSVSGTTCTGSQTITWAPQYSVYVTPLQTMNIGQAITFKWDGPTHTGIPSFATPEIVGIGASTNFKYINISTDPCDFTNNVGGQRWCAATSSYATTPSMNVVTVAPNTSLKQCGLTAGQTYYINVRNGTAPTGTDSCPAGAVCTYRLYW